MRFTGIVFRAKTKWSSSSLWCLVVSLVAVGGLLGGCPGGGFDCECFPCGSAIDLRVFDGLGNRVNGTWQVEASLDGEAVDTSACLPEERGGTNTCGFGFETGVYDIVVRSPDVEKPLQARFAGRAGQNCCGCLVGETVQVILESP